MLHWRWDSQREIKKERYIKDKIKRERKVERKNRERERRIKDIMKERKGKKRYRTDWEGHIKDMKWEKERTETEYMERDIFKRERGVEEINNRDGIEAKWEREKDFIKI